MNAQHKTWRRLLDQALHSARLSAQAQKVFMVWPALEDACQRLAGYCTPLLPGLHRPFVEECLAAAFATYKKVVNRESDEAAKAFLDALLRPAPLLVRRRIAIQDGREFVAWVPFDESVADFVARHEGKDLLVVDEPAPGGISDEMAILMLAVRIMPAHEAEGVYERVIGARVQQACA